MRFGFGAPSDQAAQTWCEHATCREDQAGELAYMGAALDRQDLKDLSKQAYHSTVRCRHQPRKGPVRAPFPDQQRDLAAREKQVSTESLNGEGR